MKSSSRPQADSLVADIGGTNTRIALAEGPSVLVDTICSYCNADHQDFTTVLEHYMATAGAVECRMACVAVAGLVQNDVAELTNLDWRVDTEMITRSTGVSTVVLLNDLQAKGYSLGYICPSHLRDIIPQPNVAHGATQLVIGIGTGFNAAVVYHLESGRFVAPAEAGHINMPIANAADLDLAQFITARNGFADVEDVASGRGIEQIYAWRGYRDARISSASVDEIIQGLTGIDPHAEAALRIFRPSVRASSRKPCADNVAIGWHLSRRWCRSRRRTPFSRIWFYRGVSQQGPIQRLYGKIRCFSD